MPCQLFAQKCSNCQEITKISNCLGSPEHSVIGNIHGDVLLTNLPKLSCGFNVYISTIYMFDEKNMSGNWIQVNRKPIGFGGSLTVFGNNRSITAIEEIQCGYGVNDRTTKHTTHND